MKKVLFFLSAIVTFSTLFTSCKEDDEETTPVVNEPANGVLAGQITGTTTLVAGKTYKMEGGVHVVAGGVLEIQKGVKINCIHADVSGSTAYLLVEQGGKIMAEGTSTEPIVFSSEKTTPGSWGGIILCGKAPVNKPSAVAEVGGVPYGGSDVADNSGVLKYVRVEYPGYQITGDKEHNGFTFNGVGNGTTLDYLESYGSADDGFEWFGGTVNAKHLISYDSGDDLFDWTFGWVGKAQYLYGKRVNTSSDDPRGIEADGQEGGETATPHSNPFLSNVTLIANTGAKEGINVRRGTKAKIYNALVVDFTATATKVDGTVSGGYVNDKSLMIDYCAFVNSTVFKYDVSVLAENKFETSTNFKQNQAVTFTGFVGTVAGGKDLKSTDSFFESTDYIGAVSASNNWTTGWSK